MKKQLLLIVIALCVSACCGGPITIKTVQIDKLDFIADTIVPTNQDFKFKFHVVETVLSTTTQDKNKTCDDESFRTDAIHYIKTMKAFVLTDFSTDYPANSQIDDLIAVTFYNSFNHRIETRKLNQWLHYVSRQSSDRGKLSEFQNASSFSISQRPSSQSNQILSFSFLLSDDTLVETITPPITWE